MTEHPHQHHVATGEKGMRSIRHVASRLFDGGGGMGTDGTLVITLPADLVEVIARRAAEIVLADTAPTHGGRWLTGGKAAAAYLGCSPKRVYNRLHEIPHVKEGGRLKFHTAALDEWLEGLTR